MRPFNKSFFGMKFLLLFLLSILTLGVVSSVTMDPASTVVAQDKDGNADNADGSDSSAPEKQTVLVHFPARVKLPYCAV